MSINVGVPYIFYPMSINVGVPYIFFIEPRDRYYSYDICPGYWSTLVQKHRASRVFSLDRIREELIPKKKDDWDDIAHWINDEVPDTFFKKTQDPKVVDSFQEIVTWVYAESQYTDAAKAEFASVADGWLVAYANANNLTVVTQEQYAPDAKRRVLIPNVCEEFGVKYVDTFQMLRTLGTKFVRSTKRTEKRRS